MRKHTVTHAHTHTPYQNRKLACLFSCDVSHTQTHQLAAMTPAMVKNIPNGIVSGEVIAPLFFLFYYPFNILEICTLQSDTQGLFKTLAHLTDTCTDDLPKRCPDMSLSIFRPASFLPKTPFCRRVFPSTCELLDFLMTFRTKERTYCSAVRYCSLLLPL